VLLDVPGSPIGCLKDLVTSGACGSWYACKLEGDLFLLVPDAFSSRFVKVVSKVVQICLPCELTFLSHMQVYGACCGCA